MSSVFASLNKTVYVSASYSSCRIVLSGCCNRPHFASSSSLLASLQKRWWSGWLTA